MSVVMGGVMVSGRNDLLEYQVWVKYNVENNGFCLEMEFVVMGEGGSGVVCFVFVGFLELVSMR